MIDFTKPVRTKSGLAVRILCTDGPDINYPVVGVVSGFTSTSVWTSNGSYLKSRGGNKLDLENAPEEVVRYIGTYGKDAPSLYFDNIPDKTLGWKQFIKCTFTDNILTHVEIVKD